MYVDGRSGWGKTLLMKVITAAVRAQGDIVLCSATTGLAALNHEGGVVVRAKRAQLLVIIIIIIFSQASAKTTTATAEILT